MPSGARRGGPERRVRLSTAGMAYGPHAVAHLDGKVVFVRGAAPEEEVEAVLTEEHRSYSYAAAVAVVRASAARRDAPCEYLPRCGGCPWQHIDYTAQLEAKRRAVVELLRRIAGCTVDVAAPIASPREFGYRQRLKLRADGGRVGFHAAASHDLVEIDHCLLAEPTVDAAIPAAADLVRSLAARVRRIEVATSASSPDRVVLACEVEGAWPHADENVCREWLAANPAVAGLAIAGRGWRRAWGDTLLPIEPEDGLRSAVRAGSFTQVNREANRVLVETVVRQVEPAEGMRVLDLFAGAGNFSLPLAKRGAEVVAVERDRAAADDARAGALRLGIARFSAVAGRAEQIAAKLAARGERFDAVVLDPPRSGAAGVIEPLLRLAARRIVYVACDPATLARDLRALGAAYRVEHVQPVDMFPQTYHVETVVRAERSC